MIHDVSLPDGRTIKTELSPVAGESGFEATVDGRTVAVEIESAADGELILCVDGRRHVLHVADRSADAASASGTEEIRLEHRNRLYLTRISSELDRLRAAARAKAKHSGPVTLLASLPGVVRQVFVAQGERVEAGAPVLTLEAMKMENELTAEISGRVEELLVTPGQTVAAREALARIVPVDEAPGGTP